MGRRVSGTGSLSRWDWLAIAVAAVVVGGPALFTGNGFAPDFTNHLWAVSVQAHAISRGIVPTYFLNANAKSFGPSAFYPFFAFYGGTAYALTGALATVLDGQVVVAYVASILAAIAAAYGGTVWLARQLGARTWRAHAPAITFVASAYYVTDLYGRGAWPEFLAGSVIPLLGASAWRIARGPSVEIVPCILFVAAAIIFSGSHNISLAWGTVVIAATLVLLLIAFGRRAMPVSRARLGWLAALSVLALGTNAWFLIVDVLHAHSTAAGAESVPWAYTSFFETPGVLFDPLRTVPVQSGTPALFVQLPVWLLGWALLSAACVRRRAGWDVIRAFLAVTVVLLALLLALSVEGVYNLLPHLLQLIQFPYRLVEYATLAIAGLVMVAVLGVERAGPQSRRRRPGVVDGALAIAVLASVALCVWQLWVPNTREPALSIVDRYQAIASVHEYPKSWYAPVDYADQSAPIVTVAPDRVLNLNPATFEGNGVTLTVTPPPGSAPFAIDILAGPYIVALHGLDDIGRTTGGEMVATRQDNGSGPVRLTVSLRSGGDIAAGRAITAACLLALAMLLAVAIARRLRDRRRRRQDDPGGTASGEEPGGA